MRLIPTSFLFSEPRASSPGTTVASMLTMVPVVGCGWYTQGGIVGVCTPRVYLHIYT